VTTLASALHACCSSALSQGVSWACGVWAMSALYLR
jgi:hypothetical protein